MSAFLLSGIGSPVAPPVDLLEYVPPASIPDKIKDKGHISVIYLWRDGDDNTQGVEIMRHLAWIFLVDPLVQFYQTPLSSDLPRPIQDAMSATFPQYLVPSPGIS